MDFESAFERHHASVFRYLQRLTGDPDRADELAQETFVRLLDHDVDPSSLESWLFTVATNLVRDGARTRKRRQELLDVERPSPDPADPPDEALLRDERRRKVRRVLDGLDRRDREMLLMREEGFSYAEIGDAVEVKTSSVGTLLSRALDRFAEAYGRDDG